jgi:hypothetical protein
VDGHFLPVLFMDVTGQSKQSRALIQQLQCTGMNNQKWNVALV